MEKEGAREDSQNEDSYNEKKVFVICPICKSQKSIVIPKSIINSSKPMTCITIAPNIVCDHVFQLYLDRNFAVRGYSKSDYEVGFLKVSENNFQEIKKNTIVKFREESPKEGISSEYWPIISKINGTRTVEEIIDSSNKDAKLVLKALFDLRSMNLITFDFLLDDYDIPVITEHGLNFLLNPKIVLDNLKNIFDDDNIYSRVRQLWEEKKFELVKFIDSKSSIVTLAEKCLIDLPDMKNILKFLQLNGFIEILSKELKLCLIFENVYELFTRSIEKFLGEKGVKIFNRLLENAENPLIKLIKFNNATKFHSFETVRINIERQKNLDVKELEELFLSPILSTFKEVKPALSLLSSNYINEFKNQVREILESLKDTFGITNMEKLKNLVY